MIGKLSGIIDSFGQGHVLLDVQGVGYLVFASARTLGMLGQSGEPASLLIDTNVREDHIHLYGFIDQAEQSWFRLLTSVQGVGAKVGLALLATCTPEQLQIAIMAQDKAVVTQADGVGPKLATRILTELKDKAASVDTGALTIRTNTGTSSQTGQVTTNSNDQDAVSALVNLGYGKADAFSAVMRVKANADNDNQDVGELIRLALKELSA
ncbi:MAG: Holliday junction branch migration protein RuvA [Alphaproteobacteria bacterium]|nr:Holliday junction branch migration protein RuvA [Alphaproteobacteria bacterium]